MIWSKPNWNKKITMILIIVFLLLPVSIFCMQVSAKSDTLDMKEKDELIYLMQINLVNDNLEIGRAHV